MTRFRTTVLASGALLASIATATLTATSATAAVPHKGAIGFVVGGDTKHPIVLVHGAINAAGKDDPNHDNYDLLKFANGTFRIVHPEAQAKFVPKINKKTCYVTFTETGKFTLSHGTGRFKGISGSGSYTAHGYGYTPRTKSGACNLNAEPAHEVFTVVANGTLK